MRYRVRPLRDSQSNALFVTSEPSGPMSFATIYGCDNLVTSKKVPFVYKVAKPYTSIVTPEHKPEPVKLAVEGQDDLVVTPPSPQQILSRIQEAQWTQELLPIFQQSNIHANNGAVERMLKYGEFLSIVTVLEGGQTIMMVRHVFLRLFQAVLDCYKTAKRLNLVATMEVLSGLWLEYRYGWRPLLADLQALKKMMTDIRVDGVKSTYGGSQVRELSDAPISIGSVSIIADLGYTFEYEVLVTPTQAFSKAGFNYLNTESSRNDDWLAKLGLDLESLPKTAWELIPFSFVVDMFINVGSILTTLNSSEQVDSFNHYVTNQLEGTVLFKCKSLSLDKPGRPFDWETHDLRYPGVTINPNVRGQPGMAHVYTPSQLFKFYLDRGQIGYQDGGENRYWPRSNTFNGYLMYFLYHYRWHTGGDCPGHYWKNPRPMNNEQGSHWSSFPISVEIHRQANNRVYPMFRIVNTQAYLQHAPALDHILPMLQFSEEMTDSEIASYWQDMCFDSSPRQVRALVNLADRNPRIHLPNIFRWHKDGNVGQVAAIRKYPVVEYNTEDFVLTQRGRPDCPGTHHGRRGIKLCTLGYHPEETLTFTDIDLSPLDYELPVKVFTRNVASEAKHLLTADLDLSTPQFADLGALAVVLTSRFRK